MSSKWTEILQKSSKAHGLDIAEISARAKMWEHTVGRLASDVLALLDALEATQKDADLGWRVAKERSDALAQIACLTPYTSNGDWTGEPQTIARAALTRLVADLETNTEKGAPDYAHDALADLAEGESAQ